MYEGVALGGLWKLMGWLPGYLLRRFFTKEDLRARIRLDVRNRPYALQLNGGDMSEATIWVEIRNAGYFTVELDRLTATLSIGHSFEFYSLDRVTLLPDATHEIYLHGPLTPGAIALYKLNRNNSNICSIQLRAEFNSKVHNFSAKTDHTSSFATHAINM